MARVPSDKTRLASTRREIRFLTQQRETVKAEREHYRVRATKAEQEVAEWKARFDKLLEFRKCLGMGERDAQ